MQPNHSSRSLALPAAIIIGFSIIAAAILFAGSSPVQTEPTQQAATNTLPDFEDLVTRLHAPIETITEADNIRGNPSAPLMFVTYTSYDCPSCRTYYQAMNRIMQEYGQTGDVAWTFRHMPLVEDYPDSKRVANAAECVAALGGNTSFWIFSDELFQDRSPLGPTDLSRVPQYATSAGISTSELTQCMNEERFFAAIDDQVNDATTAGAFSIPYTVVMTDNDVSVINGSIPFVDLRQIVNSALAATNL